MTIKLTSQFILMLRSQAQASHGIAFWCLVYKYFIAFNTHLPIKIFSPYFVDLLVLMGVALSTILLISLGETSSNHDIFFTDLQNFSTIKKRHQFFLVWSNLTIINNYSSKWRWLAVDIYRAAKRRGKYPTLATDTEVNSCFSIY